jgi:phosphate/sulfate permease
MRRLALIVVLLVPLAAAGPAQGKEVLSVTACGSDGCSTSKDGGLLRAMTDVGPPTDAPAQPAGFYRLNVTVGDGDEIAGRDRLSWVPSAGMLLTRDGTWIAVRPEIRSGLDELTRGLDALPARRLAGFPADAATPTQAPSTSATDDTPIWILVTAAAALLIGGLLVRGHRIARRPGLAASKDRS